VINLEDATVVEKRGRGRPRGSKNKPNAYVMDASSLTPAKRCRGCPLGSKNKVKAATTLTSTGDHLDISLAQPIMTQSSVGNVFSFFAFTGAQCYEQHRLPLKFTQFMDGWELREAIL
jgi:hypothetical protein